MRSKMRIKKANSEIPTASTADIAFLLIVFFMVTSVIAATKGIEFRLPRDEDSKDAQVEDIEAVHIVLPNDGGFRVDQQPMNITQLRNYVRERLELTNYNQFIIVQCEDNVSYGRLVQMLDILRDLNARNIALPTKSEIESWGM